ncbi:diadenylate cyclase CdaA [Coprothermobacter platensis]|uniref:diadenylate cyclase CdaA n=1 Tax=Coprothermobacter platensis TaxID=108819 RepID=UPI00037C3542|nr:diadenylate cyclase CdaA [Coprothermobacter platensis]
MINALLPSFGTILGAVIDIALVTALLYWLLSSIYGTRGYHLARGLLIILAGLAVLSWLGRLFSSLQLTRWVFNNVATMMIFAIPVIFQPELRRALEEFSLDPFRNLFRPVKEYDMEQVISEVVRAAELLSANRTGALIVFEGNVGLKDIIAQSGTMLNAEVSADLLLSIFNTRSPLHDGAVVIRKDRIVAARVILPLADRRGDHIGTRHRAAIGITEETDAVALVVSEETGVISFAYKGHLTRYVELKDLPFILESFISGGNHEA